MPHPRARRTCRRVTTRVATAALLLALVAAGTALGRSAHHKRPHARRAATTAPVLSCAQLAGVDVSQAAGASVGITSATAGTAQQGGYPVCDVKGVIAPQIQFELTLPTNTYTGRYLQTGCGGLCGNLSISAPAATGCAPLNNGEFAMASDNMGHVAAGNNDGNFGTDPQLRIDFAYRADHVLALAAKALIAQFYGGPPQYSYFDGCSEGGHEGLAEVQRYPHDFNGVLAGAPATITQELNTFYQPWLAGVDFDSSGRQIMPASKLAVLHQAVLANCDGKDGLVDGQIDDPRACTFSPQTLACPGDVDAPTCLTQAQIAVVEKVYSGPVDPAGRHLYPGGEPMGSELAWSPWLIPPSPTGAQNSTIAWSIGNGWLKYLAYDPNPPLSFSVKNATFDDATFQRAEQLSGFWNDTDTDLSAFRNAGGKLILWQGWADQAISPYGTIAYYAAIRQEMGGLAATQKFARLFMFPGMYHCQGGYGPNSFDLLSQLQNWVENGQAPTHVVASALNNSGQTVRTRPVYAYPLVARYNGNGSTDDAANFHPAQPDQQFVDRYRWLGHFEAHSDFACVPRGIGLRCSGPREGDHPSSARRAHRPGTAGHRRRPRTARLA
jgi:hypothetical protein